MSESKRQLRVFLCHASADKPVVRDLYRRLVRDGVDVWMDEVRLLPGMDWKLEIPRVVQKADAIIICLSSQSVTKEGYVQKEIRFALDTADEKPDGTIYILPVRLDACEIPSRLARWQWVDFFRLMAIASCEFPCGCAPRLSVRRYLPRAGSWRWKIPM
jgi:hypothetical protein